MSHRTYRTWPVADKHSDRSPDRNQPAPLQPDAEDADLLDAYSRAVVHVVESVSPAVIAVTGEKNDRSAGSGSGFLITPDGYAVTNSHVVASRTRLTGETLDGDQIAAEVIGDDPSTDTALLRLAAGDLPYCQFGDSDALRVGQLVIAMGSPLGLHSTVSTGVVSAVRRSMRAQDGRLIDNVVQHAAPINPGSSGGPLVDSRGRVVGVNTAIIAYAQGLGFAVPSETVQWVTGELLAHGRVRRRQLGIVAANTRVARTVMREADLLADEAVAVAGIAPDSPAQRAGLREGDLIVALNDRLVCGVDDIHRLLTQLAADVPIVLTVVREGVKSDVRLT